MLFSPSPPIRGYVDSIVGSNLPSRDYFDNTTTYSARLQHDYPLVLFVDMFLAESDMGYGIVCAVTVLVWFTCEMVHPDTNRQFY